MNKTIWDKMGIKENSRCYFQNPPENFTEIIQSPQLNISNNLNGKFDYIHIFVISKSELDQSIKNIKTYLSTQGQLWISWPKSKQLDTDINLPIVIKIVYENGLVESKVISIDSTWSAIKITRPIEGKTYKNSFGVLNQKK